ncbi:hypothetical protein [Bacteriophage sp.]|nr:hypothetical protein [Bacteriophage sp.]UOF80136.1 hypothetical protein [Bacteriophage sp.]
MKRTGIKGIGFFSLSNVTESKSYKESVARSAAKNIGVSLAEYKSMRASGHRRCMGPEPGRTNHWVKDGRDRRQLCDECRARRKDR